MSNLCTPYIVDEEGLAAGESFHDADERLRRASASEIA